jgi:hypothetical protein
MSPSILIGHDADAIPPFVFKAVMQSPAQMQHVGLDNETFGLFFDRGRAFTWPMAHAPQQLTYEHQAPLFKFQTGSISRVEITGRHAIVSAGATPAAKRGAQNATAPRPAPAAAQRNK